MKVRSEGGVVIVTPKGWLVGEAGAELVFSPDDAGKWGAALKSMGIDPLSLSSAAGRA